MPRVRKHSVRLKAQQAEILGPPQSVPGYLPTPEEIAEACDRLRELREVVHDRWTPPGVHEPLFPVNA